MTPTAPSSRRPTAPTAADRPPFTRPQPRDPNVPRVPKPRAMQVLRGSRQLTDSGLVHLFLLPPKQGDPRFAIYETTQPTGFDLTLAETIQLATKAVRRADGDPRIVDGVDPRWRGVDPRPSSVVSGHRCTIRQLGPGTDEHHDRAPDRDTGPLRPHQHLARKPRPVEHA